MVGEGELEEKNKYEIKLEEHETEFQSIRIDMVRFAYDIFKYSASKFGIEDNCLSAWHGSENDYKFPEVFLAMCRVIIVNQLKFRCKWHTWFKSRFDSDGPVSLELIRKLLEDCTKCLQSEKHEFYYLFVEESLSLTCELILFLYTEGKDLCLTQLAECWFECCFRKQKKNFKEEGGLDITLVMGYGHTCDYPHNFIDLWIKTCYHDYKKSVKDENLYHKFLNSSAIYKQKSSEYKYAKNGATSSSIREKVARIMCSLSLSSKREEASGISLPPHPRLGVPLPHQMYDFDLAAVAAQSQKLPEAIGQELSKRTKRQTHQERKRNRKLNFGPGEEQGHGQTSLDASRTKQSREKNPSVSMATDTTQSHEHLGAKAKNTVRNRKSSDLQRHESSLCSSEEQDLGRLSFGSSRTKRPGEKTPMPSICKYLKFLKASGQGLSKHTKGPSYLEGERNRTPSLRLSVEQGLEQLSLDSTGTKQSS